MAKKSKGLIEALNKALKATSKAEADKVFVSFLSKTAKLFWSSEGNAGQPATCSRDWVEKWELFEIVDDAFSGKQNLRSRQTRMYASVHADNYVYFDQNRATLETRFEVDMDNGYIKAYNGNYITNPNDGGPLEATSMIPVSYDIFHAKPVVISNPDVSRYVRPSNGKLIITPGNYYVFYLLTNDYTGETYLETGEAEFIDAHNGAQNVPVGYSKTKIDTKTFTLAIETIDKDDSIYSIQSDASRMYFDWDSSIAGDFVYCNFKDSKGLQTHFKIVAGQDFP
jgi:hypothetical protein